MQKINHVLLDNLANKAMETERKRKNYNFHTSSDDVLQRMLNALEPDSYVRPHKHESPHKREVFIVLRGRIVVIEFDNTGGIKDHIILDSKKGNFGVEIASCTWHTIISLESGSVAYELKDGPYNPKDDKVFAPWAPVENTNEGLSYIYSILDKLNV